MSLKAAVRKKEQNKQELVYNGSISLETSICSTLEWPPSVRMHNKAIPLEIQHARLHT